MSAFFIFTPVPLRRRCDGWSPDLQLRFVRLLAEGVKPGEAARLVGRNRQNAYALRKRAGAESFAAAWDAASAFGAGKRHEAAPVPRAPRPAPPPPAPVFRRGASPEMVEAVRRMVESYPRLPGPQGAAKNDKSDKGPPSFSPSMGS
jgi:hypothetical protein